MSKRVLVVGSGGREHALAWKLAASEQVEQVIVAPGNGGTHGGKLESVAVAVTDHAGLLALAAERSVDLIVIGPDDALAAGLADECRAAGFATFGPSAAAAQIESSKAFAKELMHEAGIPTATHRTFTEIEAAEAYVKAGSFPVVVKASGLALGKGVYICQDEAEALTALQEIMNDKKFGESGNEVVIEEFMVGTELSTHVFSDGERAVLFPPSQDYKQVGDGDTGPNTGGMGVVAPLPWVSEAMMDEARERIAEPALQALREKNAAFSGLLYPGLMATEAGLKVVEFNARFGDPETQAYMRLLQSDLYEVLYACAAGTLTDMSVAWRDEFVCCVTLASAGYPGSYEKGKEITGIAAAEEDERVKVFHAGTKLSDDTLETSGGRVLSVTATAATLAEAIDAAYTACAKIEFDGKYLRNDIGSNTINKT